MNAVGGCKLPFGNLPRLLMAWLSTEAVRTQSRELVLGRSLAEFMRTLGVLSSDSGGASGVRTRLRNQMRRLFNAHVRLVYEDEHGEQFVSSAIADRGAFWWNERKPDQPSLWESKIYLGEQFFNEIINHPVPLDMNILKALKRSAWASISTSGLSTGRSHSVLRSGSLGSSCTASLERTRPKPAKTTPFKPSVTRFSAS